MKAKIVCSVCKQGPLNGRSLYRDKGALFYGYSKKGVGSLFCAAHAPVKIKKAILDSGKTDCETKRLAAAKLAA